MKTIYKYTLDPSNTMIEIPSDNLLSCESQGGNIVVYALVDTDDLTPITYSFKVVGTGQPVSFDENNYTFLNTVKMVNDRFMFHIFYKKINDDNEHDEIYEIIKERRQKDDGKRISLEEVLNEKR